jgi:hypothetical protein
MMWGFIIFLSSVPLDLDRNLGRYESTIRKLFEA